MFNGKLTLSNKLPEETIYFIAGDRCSVVKRLDIVLDGAF